MKSIPEEMGDTYILGEDSMYYPNLALPVEDKPHYGKYGCMNLTGKYSPSHAEKMQKPHFAR